MDLLRTQDATAVSTLGFVGSTGLSAQHRSDGLFPSPRPLVSILSCCLYLGCHGSGDGVGAGTRAVTELLGQREALDSDVQPPSPELGF